MSIPKSKILSTGRSNCVNVSKGVMALAKVRRDTNQCENVQNQQVNINIKSTPDGESLIMTKDGVSTVVDRDALEDVTTVCEAGSPSGVAENTGVDIAINKALSLIIDLLESNPLMVNKYIVPHESAFIELVQTLTLADSIEIKYNDVEIGCCGLTSTSYSLVDKIYVVKSDETASLLYNYPDVIQLLDDHMISYQWIVRDAVE